MLSLGSPIWYPFGMTLEKKTYPIPPELVEVLSSVDPEKAQQILDSFLNLNASISKLKNQVDALKRADDLTGLANQHQMYEFLSHEIQRSNRYGSPLSVCFLDLDYFKQVNTNYGHQTGSKILKEVAKLLKAQIRSLDLGVRFGGDEFVLILPQTNQSGAYIAAERFRNALSAKPVFLVDGHEIHITASIGISTYEKPESKESLLDRADTMLRAAKSNGRNQTVFAEEPPIHPSEDMLIVDSPEKNQERETP